MGRISVVVAIAAVMLAGCSPSDQQRAQEKVRQAGQELKQDAEHLKENPKVHHAGEELKQDAKKAEVKAKQGYDEANREIRKGLNGADQDLKKKTER